MAMKHSKSNNVEERKKYIKKIKKADQIFWQVEQE
jgi:hypothetical protein